VVVPDTPESLMNNEIGEAPVEGAAPDGTDVHPDTRRAAEHLEDLRRLQAEYVNYKKRVDRDREQARDRAVTQVVEALLPVLDDIHAAREHGELEDGPFAAIADKLENTLGRFGVQRLGAKGEEFDPVIHEALMHVDAELPDDATTTTVVQVIQPGFKMGERVVRPARVSVADPH
jgi:molecular chaperone GrpE